MKDLASDKLMQCNYLFTRHLTSARPRGVFLRFENTQICQIMFYFFVGSDMAYKGGTDAAQKYASSAHAWVKANEYCAINVSFL